MAVFTIIGVEYPNPGAPVFPFFVMHMHDICVLVPTTRSTTVAQGIPRVSVAWVLEPRRRPGRRPLDTVPALARLHLAAERRHAVTTP